MKTKDNINKNQQFAVRETQRLRIKKTCFGCGDYFCRSRRSNYDYCLNCTIDGKHYLPGKFSENRCAECRDGSGLIKLSNQLVRACKLCSLRPRIVQREVKYD